MSQPGPDGETPKPAKRISLMRTCPACGTKFPAEGNICPECRTNYERARGMRPGDETGRSPYAPEEALFEKGIWGGVALLAIGVVWLFLGWQAGYIYYWPIFLVALGIGGIVAGIANRKRPQTRSARRKTYTRRRR